MSNAKCAFNRIVLLKMRASILFYCLVGLKAACPAPGYVGVCFLGVAMSIYATHDCY